MLCQKKNVIFVPFFFAHNQLFFQIWVSEQIRHSQLLYRRHSASPEVPGRRRPASSGGFVDFPVRIITLRLLSFPLLHHLLEHLRRRDLPRQPFHEQFLKCCARSLKSRLDANEGVVPSMSGRLAVALCLAMPCVSSKKFRTMRL